MASPRERPILEATLQIGEVALDAIAKGDALADVPIIGTVFKILKATDSLRDRALAAKLAKFIAQLDHLPQEFRERLKRKIAASQQDAVRIGETLFLVIDRTTDLEKPELIALLFIAYIDDVITAEDLRRLCHAIDSAFYEDIRSLLKLQGRKQQATRTPQWMQNLTSSGLTFPRANQVWDDDGIRPDSPCLRL